VCWSSRVQGRGYFFAIVAAVYDRRRLPQFPSFPSCTWERPLILAKFHFAHFSFPQLRKIGSTTASTREGLSRTVIAINLCLVSTLEIIVEDLKALPTPKLAEVAAYVHRLRETNREERLSAIARSAEILSDSEGEELSKIIHEGCEKIDARDW